MINLPSIILWGFAGTTTLTTLLMLAQTLGLTRIDIPFIVGTMFTSNRDRAKVLGYVIHVLNGWWFAIAYAFFFQALGRATWWIGGMFGAIQGMTVATVIFPLLPGVHPRMVSDSRGPEPTRLLEPPGFFTTNYGRLTPAIIIAGHAVYGAIIGAFYRLA